MPKGEQNTGQELGAAFFGADLDGLYKQHEAMWGVYIESLKILVTITSLPLLAAALFIHEGKELQLAHVPSLLKFILILTPVFDFFMIAVVINHRLTILFYARGINGYRGLFLENSPPDKKRFEECVRLPIGPNTLPPYEPFGPMGMVVHAIALLGGIYWWLACTAIWKSACAAGVCVAIFEWWYYFSCRRQPSKVAEVKAQAHR